MVDLVQLKPCGPYLPWAMHAMGHGLAEAGLVVSTLTGDVGLDKASPMQDKHLQHERPSDRFQFPKTTAVRLCEKRSV